MDLKSSDLIVLLNEFFSSFHSLTSSCTASLKSRDFLWPESRGIRLHID